MRLFKTVVWRQLTDIKKKRYSLTWPKPIGYRELRGSEERGSGTCVCDESKSCI